MDALAVGDVVILKALGPRMVVTSIARDRNEVYCEWFVENAEVKGHHFPPEALKKISDQI